MPGPADPITPGNWPLMYGTPAHDAWVALIRVFGLDPTQAANTPAATPPVVTFGTTTATLDIDVFALDQSGHRFIDSAGDGCVRHRLTMTAPVDDVITAVNAT